MSDESGIPERLAYSINETARLLGVSTSTVKRLLASHKLRYVRIGEHRRIPRQALYDLLDAPDRVPEEAVR